jgi:hypothetical protein
MAIKQNIMQNQRTHNYKSDLHTRKDEYHWSMRFHRPAMNFPGADDHFCHWVNETLDAPPYWQ